MTNNLEVQVLIETSIQENVLLRQLCDFSNFLLNKTIGLFEKFHLVIR